MSRLKLLLIGRCEPHNPHPTIDTPPTPHPTAAAWVWSLRYAHRMLSIKHAGTRRRTCANARDASRQCLHVSSARSILTEPRHPHVM